jgi:hypothetical protein
MTVDELRVHLNNLINKYVTDEPARQRLLKLVEREDIPAKGILVELTPFTSGLVSEEDRRLIGEIAFYYC